MLQSVAPLATHSKSQSLLGLYTICPLPPPTPVCTGFSHVIHPTGPPHVVVSHILKHTRHTQRGLCTYSQYLEHSTPVLQAARLTPSHDLGLCILVTVMEKSFLTCIKLNTPHTLPLSFILCSSNHLTGEQGFCLFYSLSYTQWPA